MENKQVFLVVIVLLNQLAEGNSSRIKGAVGKCLHNSQHSLFTNLQLPARQPSPFI